MLEFIPEPIDSLVDFLYKEMKGASRIKLEPAEEEIFKNFIKQLVFASHALGEVINPEKIMTKMKTIAELPRNERDMLYASPKGLSLDTVDAAIEFNKKMSKDQRIEMEEKLDRVTLALSKDPRQMNDVEKAQYEKDLKNVLTELIKSLDKENKLSPHDQEKLAQECAHKLMRKPTMETLKEIINDIKKNVGLEADPTMQPNEEKTHEQPLALRVMPPIPEGGISPAQFGELKDSGLNVQALAISIGKLNMNGANPAEIASHITAVYDRIATHDGGVAALCEEFGIERHGVAPRLTPPGA